MKIFEFNKNDKYLIKSLNDMFTISLEFELETDDKNNTTSNKNTYLKIARKNSNDYIRINKDTNHNNSDSLKSLVEEILSQLELTDDIIKEFFTIKGEDTYNDYNTEIFEEYLELYDKGTFENDLIQVLHADYITYWLSDNIDYLSSKVKEHMPKFYNKWNKRMKFELDTTLKRGIEFSPLTYIDGIENAINMIDDFYSEFEIQNYWYMSSRTGIHVNIGVNYKANWNILKGLLMISDEGDQSFTFKDMEWRQKSLYTKTFLPQLRKDIESEKNTLMKHTQFNDIKKLESFFSGYILKQLEKHGYKNYGFNITKIKTMNYVEFRYPGGQISKDVLINKIYYFCYVIYLMINEKYKRREYLKKLYKFIDNI